jgi:Phage integrase family
LVPHGLRHTAASLAIAAGADVKVVQQMLGHKSATMTLDLYGHLFDDRLDEVADALDRAAQSSEKSTARCRCARRHSPSPGRLAPAVAAVPFNPALEVSIERGLELATQSLGSQPVEARVWMANARI